MHSTTNDQSVNSLPADQDDAVTRCIKAIRAEKKINQVMMATFFGIDRSSYHRMENRGEKLSIEQLQRIASFLDVSLLDLLTQEPTPVPPTSQPIVPHEDQIQALTDRLADKQQLAELINRSLDQIAHYVEVLLARYARHIKLETVGTDQPPVWQVNGILLGDAVEQFKGLAETVPLVDQSYTGRQLVYLAVNMSLLQENFFLLVVKLIELSLLDPTSLYARAFLFVYSTQAVYRAELSGVQKRRNRGDKSASTSIAKQKTS